MLARCKREEDQSRGRTSYAYVVDGPCISRSEVESLSIGPQSLFRFITIRQRRAQSIPQKVILKDNILISTTETFSNGTLPLVGQIMHSQSNLWPDRTQSSYRTRHRVQSGHPGQPVPRRCAGYARD